MGFPYRTGFSPIFWTGEVRYEGAAMLDYQITAIDRVRDYARIKNEQSRAYVEQLCSPFNVDIQALVRHVLCNPITINFHPDRFSSNGKTIMENLLVQGQYLGQFRTGTTNGGKTAYIGGDRFLWEQRIFHDAYPQDSVDRPVYGALNLLRYIDGASARFGSCFFVLKPEIMNRCTFAYGDSSTNPAAHCTSDTFFIVLAALFEDIQKNGRMLNQVVSSVQEALTILLSPSNELKIKGRNLDYCIETHIHGDVLLGKDIESFYVDESFQQTVFAEQADALCKRYGIALIWIPKRQVNIEAIGELFRGPMIPPLAKKIDRLFGNNQGIIHAALIGQASRDSLLNPEAWKDIGNEVELFQYIKQLWHTIAYFG